MYSAPQTRSKGFLGVLRQPPRKRLDAYFYFNNPLTRDAARQTAAAAGAWIALGLLAGFSASCGPRSHREAHPDVRVSAAASLEPVLQTLAPTIQQELGLRLRLNAAGSGTLARQLKAGAAADAVLLAHPDWLAPLAEAGRVRADRVTELAGNALVVVGRGPPIRLEELAAARFKKIALADPDAVPAGRYARQALRAAGVWDAVAPRVVPTADVRAALRYAQTHEVDAAVVYASDAAGLAPGQDPRALGVLCEVDPRLHDRIVVATAAVDGSEGGRRLIAWLRDSEPARRAFEAAGFGVP